MRIQEIYHSGVSDGEEFDSERTALKLSATIQFAHEQQLGGAFEQLVQLPEFKAAMEEELAKLTHATMQRFIRQSSIPAGSGWTDDFTVEISISPDENTFS